MKNSKKGFTLIELLIVIALLGALAVALLAALDPLEQVKKGTDTGVRNTAAEIQAAAVRYSAIKGGVMPFSGTLAWQAVGTVITGTAYTAVQAIIDTGELKQDFFKLAGDQLLSVYMTGINDPSTGTQKLAACFVPTSKSFKADNNTKWIDSTNGTVSEAVCTNGTTSSSAACYWCVQ